MASEYPERVKQLEALIEKHLVDTQAVRPLPNPRFDPLVYDETQEGKATLRGGANTPKKTRRKPPGKPVAGWQPGGTCKLSLSDGRLRVSSTGTDTYLSYQLPRAMGAGDLALHITMKSESAGKGRVFWKSQGRAFSAQRSQEFSVNHDGREHLYVVEFSVDAPVRSVRIDPSNESGTIEISSIESRSKNGQTLHEWEF